MIVELHEISDRAAEPVNNGIHQHMFRFVNYYLPNMFVMICEKEGPNISPYSATVLLDHAS